MKPRSASTVPLPIAYTPAHIQHQVYVLEKFATFSDFFEDRSNVYLRALCHYSSTLREVTAAILLLDEQFKEAESNRYIEKADATEIKAKIKKMLTTVNCYAKDKLEFSSDRTARPILNKKNLTVDEKLHQGVFQPLLEQMEQINKLLEKSMHRPKARTICEGIAKATRFLFRNLIFGSIAVVFSSLGFGVRGLACLVCCCSLSENLGSYRYSMLKAWGNKSSIVRWNIQQTNNKLMSQFGLGMFKWVVGNSRGNSVKNEPRDKSKEEKAGHVSYKKKLVTEEKSKVPKKTF